MVCLLVPCFSITSVCGNVVQVPVQLEYNRRAIQLSLLVACMYTAVGLFNLGFLTNFLSHSVRLGPLGFGSKLGFRVCEWA